MNVFKRKSIYLAVAAGLGAVGMAGTASAVNVNSNGTGQVLIYPYYTVRGGTDTYLSVVNTTNSAKAVKVRFTEGRNSREVLDFNLYMSPYDTWTGAVVATTNGAKVVTTDTSCTYPAIPAAGKEFVNYGYYQDGTVGATEWGIVDAGDDGEDGTLDRTREGYFEIIEMGVITNADIAAAVTHSSGVPDDCSVVQNASLNMSITSLQTMGGEAVDVDVPAGGLAGTASLVNPALGTDFSYDPVALSDFSDAGIWYAAGTISPDMRDASPVTSRIFKAGAVVTTNWTGSVGDDAVNAVSAVLMHENVINEYVLDTVTESGTDWVVTMPTKRYYVPVDDGDQGLAATAPFTEVFYTNGACEPVTITYWDREEQQVTQEVDFSPPPPSAPGACLPWESTVVTFNNSDVLASSNSQNVDLNYENGWLMLSFTQTYASLAAAGNAPAGVHTYIGLPTVGFMVQDFTNLNAAPNVMATYGGNFSHKYTTNINGSTAE